VDTVANWFGYGFESLLPAFQRPSFAYEIAICGLALALLLIGIAIARAWWSQSLLRPRSRVIEKAILSQPDNPRLGFAQNWQSIDTAMLDRAGSNRSSTAKRLRVAWEEFRETLVDLDKPEIRNTQRPHDYFDSAVRAPTWLDFCANLFVGAGLLLTFLGLVSALKEASGGISSPDAQQTQAALTHLLAVASTKFVTSIVGVGLSIILKIVDRVLEQWLRGGVGSLCGLIERGLHHIPPQGLAAEQLVELRQQTTQLKSFATELAVAIGDKLNQSMSQAMTPVAASIENLAAAVDRSREEQMQALRDGVGRAVNGAASGELRALSDVLSGVSGALGTMQSVVSTSGDADAKQIAGAADRFEQVAIDMRAAFEELARRISSMGTDVTEQGKAHAESLRGQFDALVANMEAANSKQREMLSSSATQFGEASGRAMADVFRATESAAQRIGESAAVSMGAAADAASAAMSEAGLRIATSLDGVVSKAERAGEAFGRVDMSLDRHASSLNAISDRTASAADALKGVLQAVASATVATQQTTSLLRDVVSQFEKGALSAKQSLDQTGALIAQIETHQKRVNETWESYRKHFEGVDAHLGGALQKWSEQHREAIEVLSKHVNGIDGSMGTAVSRLRDVVQPLSDLAEELSVRRTPPQAAE
jgi:hypothetical protein